MTPGLCRNGHEMTPENKAGAGHGCRQCRRQRDRDRRAGVRTGRAADWGPKSERLPVEPLRQWIERVLDEGVVTAFELCERAGVSHRRLWGIRSGESAQVQLDTVDRIVVALGDPGVLNELYPLEVA